MKKFATIFGHLLVGLSIIFLLIKLRGDLNRIPHLNWGLSATLGLSVAIAFSTGTVAIGAYVWLILLQGGEVFLPFRQAFTIMGRAQMGKYLPGNVFQYLGRISIGTTYGIPAESILLSTGVETLVAVATAMVIAIVGFVVDEQALLWSTKALSSERTAVFGVAIVLMGAIFAAAIWFSTRVRRWIRPRLAYLHTGRLAAAAILYAVEFILFGGTIAILLATLWRANTGLEWYQFIGGFALAWVLGFITPGAPGGIGIREAVFVGLYGARLGNGLAIGLALMLRLVTSLGDLLAFGLAYWSGRKRYPETNSVRK